MKKILFVLFLLVSLWPGYIYTDTLHGIVHNVILVAPLYNVTYMDYKEWYKEFGYEYPDYRPCKFLRIDIPSQPDFGTLQYFVFILGDSGIVVWVFDQRIINWDRGNCGEQN